MKKLMLAVLALCLATVPASADWNSAVAASPGANAVLVEVIATADQQASFCVFAAATVAATLRVQHRNTANDTTLREQYLPIPAGSTSNEFCISGSLGSSGYVVNTDERIRVINNSAVIGTVSVSLQGVY